MELIYTIMFCNAGMNLSCLHNNLVPAPSQHTVVYYECKKKDDCVRITKKR